jgi:hypothetical protein
MFVALFVTYKTAAPMHNAPQAVQNQERTEAQYKNYYKCEFRIPKNERNTRSTKAVSLQHLSTGHPDSTIFI